MKNNQDIQALLLDTSFLLPTLGIDVGDSVSQALKILDQHHNTLFYSGYSLLETSWIVSRLSEKRCICHGFTESGVRQAKRATPCQRGNAVRLPRKPGIQTRNHRSPDGQFWPKEIPPGRSYRHRM